MALQQHRKQSPKPRRFYMKSDFQDFKINCQQSKHTVYRMEENLVQLHLRQVLIFRTYKEQYKSNTQTAKNNANKKMNQRNGQTFLKIGNVEKDNKYFKYYLKTIIISGMQINLLEAQERDSSGQRHQLLTLRTCVNYPEERRN